MGKLYLFVAIDRTSKFAFVRLVERATRREAADFLGELIAFTPYKIHTVRTYHYDGHGPLREYLVAFLNAYNFAKRLETLAGLTSFQFICSCWQKEPHRFITNPHRLSSGLNSYSTLGRIKNGLGLFRLRIDAVVS